MPQLTPPSRQRDPLIAHADFWEWQLRARCRFTDSATFFGSADETQGQRLRRERSAKQICGHCVVRMRCLAHALRTPERHGVWGGRTERERTRAAESTPPITARGR